MCKHFMNDILNKTIVLVLNRNWQAINIRTPQEAFCQMATNVATALEIDGENHIRPVTWDEWITLPIRDGDNAVHTVRGAIRVPTVIVASIPASCCARMRAALITFCPVHAAARTLGRTSCGPTRR